MTEEPRSRKRRPAKAKAGDAAAVATDAAAAAEATAGVETEEAVKGPSAAESPAAETAAADRPAAEDPAAEAATAEAPAGPAGGSAAEEAPEDEHRPLTDQERAELYKQQLKELRLLDVARDMMLTLVTVGYQKLGLTDETRELRDLDDAHLAIELLRGILAAVEGVAGADEMETYRATLAQMQFNYARVATEG
jgi:hypothetical protein